MARRASGLVALLILGAGCTEVPVDSGSGLSLLETLAGSDTVGYARAMEPRAFSFPSDHGAHPEFRAEWWYVTGNLADETGRPFGFQLTIFRRALAPVRPESPSRWATNQAFLAHFTLTDVEAGTFHAFERVARGAQGLAGAEADPLRAWVEDWALEGDGVGSVFPIRVSAQESQVGLRLALDQGKPVVLQGDAGLSRKGPEAGEASYYYSLTRMPTRGTVWVGPDTLSVNGLSWLDREWSTSALSDGQVGWDWFALHLDDGWDLMAYRLRSADGSAHVRSEAVAVDPSGNATRLAWGSEILVDPTGRWTSPSDGTSYPSGWRVRVPSRGWELEVDPLLPDQELDLTFRYWEGAVSVSGTAAGVPLSGRGYAELTGYAGEEASQGGGQRPP
jgi:predicted secreted hydrolase